MAPRYLNVLLLCLAGAAGAASPAVRLDLGARGAAPAPGWQAWPVPGGDGHGPLTRRVPPSWVDPDGFRVTIGPAAALGLRSAGACTGEAAVAIRESLFAHAETPLTLTFSGLRPGPCILTLWLNDARGYVWPPVRIEITDAEGVDRVAAQAQPQTAAQDSAQAARAVLGITVREHADVLVRLRLPPQPKTYVFLSALEIRRPGEPELALVEELATPRRPLPCVGALAVDPDTPLTWAAAFEMVQWDVWAGTSPEALQQVASGLQQASYAGRFEPGSVVYWRVDGRLHDRRVSGPLWRFHCGTAITLDDFEGYHPGNRLADTWDDGRAGLPARGPLIELTADGQQALRLRHPGGAVTLRCGLAKHPDWTAGGMTHLALRYRCTPPTLEPAFGVRVTNAAGQTRELPLTSAPAGGAPGSWTGAAGALVAADAMALTGLRELALVVTTAAPGQVVLDDLGLECRGRPPAPLPATVRRARLDTLRGAPPAPAPAAGEEALLRADVCVVGGGSGGIGAALAAARGGARVVLIERETWLGGTSTAAGVSSWEPGPGSSLAREIYERLSRRHDGVICHGPQYEQTLTRAGMKSLAFEPAAFHEEVSGLLRATGRCRVLLGTMCTEVTVDAEAKRVLVVGAVGRDGSSWRIRAGVFIDCTGGAYLCQAAGCEVMLGAEARDRFGEPDAPAAPAAVLNAIELIYRIRPAPAPQRQALPEGQKPRQGGAAWGLPSGDCFVNPCGGLAPGWLLMAQGYEATRAELEQRALAHWHWLQSTTYPGFEFDSFYPMLAIRESHRVVGEYVLTENDLVAGLAGQSHPDIIALADHPMDTHGGAGGLKPVAAPYGIPFRCLVPQGGWRNLLVACRGASFSHLAASSCRLSRTMMALGQAAGLAAAQCTESGGDIPEVDVAAIRQQLGLAPTP